MTDGDVLCLVLISERHGERIYRLRPGVTLIGRHPDRDVSVPDAQVSNRHAEVFERDGEHRIRDLGSTNGTRVNGVLVKDHPLRANDRIELGRGVTLFLVRRPRADVERAAAAAAAASGPPAGAATVAPSSVLFAPITALDAPGAAREPWPLARAGGFLDERTLALLERLLDEIAAAPTRDAAIDAALDAALGLLPGDSVHLLAAAQEGSDGEPFTLLRARARPELAARGIPPASRTILDWVARHRTAATTEDALHDERFDGSESVATRGIRAVMAAPVILDGALRGAVYVESTAPGYLFSRGELRLLQVLARAAWLRLGAPA